MAETTTSRRLRRRLAVALAGALLLAAFPAGGAQAAPPTVQAWLGDGASWPQRALVVFAPHGTTVTPVSLHVSENGARVGSLSVTPLSQAGPRDFGLLVLIDRGHSMAGAPLDAAVAAVRTLGAARRGAQELGLDLFGAGASVPLALTPQAGAIDRALAATPASVPGSSADLPGAIRLGLSQIVRARVALGAIVVISDGVGQLTTRGGTTSAAVRAEAAVLNVPLFTVGVQDGASTATSLGNLRSVAGGQLVQAPPARLGSVLSEIDDTVTRGYIARWRSNVRAGASVAVTVGFAGKANEIHAGYAIPAPRRGRVTSGGPRSADARAFASRQRLSSRPNFGSVAAARPAPVRPPAAPAADASFWSSQSGTITVGVIVALLLTATLALLVYRPARRAVRTRVINFLPDPEPEPDSGEPTLASASKPRGGIAERIEKGNRWPAFVEDVEIAGSTHAPIALVKRAAAAGLLAGVLVTLISGSVPLGLVPMVGWPWVLRKLYARKARKMRDTFRELLPIYLQDLASAMRVGRSFTGGLAAISDGADEPLKSALERVTTDEALGMPIEEALDRVAERMQNADLSQVALIAGLNRRSGSNVSEALDRVAEGARERADLRREIRALTAQAKMSSWVLTALPGVLLLGMSLVSPLYTKPLFHTTLGIALLCLGAGLVFAGWKVLKKITEVEA